MGSTQLDCAKLVPCLLGSSPVCWIVLLNSRVHVRPMVCAGRICLGLKSSPQGKLEMSYLMDHKWTQGIVEFLASPLQGVGGVGGGGGAAGKVTAIMSLEFVPR